MLSFILYTGTVTFYMEYIIEKFWWHAENMNQCDFHTLMLSWKFENMYNIYKAPRYTAHTLFVDFVARSRYLRQA